MIEIIASDVLPPGTALLISGPPEMTPEQREQISRLPLAERMRELARLMVGQGRAVKVTGIGGGTP